ncbi:MAG: hypothetical protein R3350_07945 [Saprospiraceae bacterium]|nr:hypothetical protein [Saprospiraceae bacterium]
MTWINASVKLVLAVCLLSSCQFDNGEAIPDVSGIDVNVDLRRFEQDLFSIDTTRIGQELSALEERYPEFSAVYFDRILRSRQAPQGHEEYVLGFIQHSGVRRLYDTVQTVYPQMEEIHEDFQQAFRHFQYYFPWQSVPNVTTFISEYTIMAFIYGNNSLAVGLDFFLGEDYPYQRYNPQNTNFSSYLTRTFNRDHLVVKTLQPLVDELSGPPSGDRLLDLMIHHGKKLYIMDRLLPLHPDSIIMEVKQEELAWLEENEIDIWAYFLNEDLLYSSDWQKIRKYIEYSPHSPGMPPEAPGRTASWLGWQIVRSYMKRQPEVDLQALIDVRDAQALLDESRYKPRRQ